MYETKTLFCTISSGFINISAQETRTKTHVRMRKWNYSIYYATQQSILSHEHDIIVIIITFQLITT